MAFRQKPRKITKISIQLNANLDETNEKKRQKFIQNSVQQLMSIHIEQIWNVDEYLASGKQACFAYVD